MPIATASTMPQGLEDFPWSDLLHTWSYGCYGNHSIRLTLWYQPEDYSVPALTMAESAWDLHLDVWSWLESSGLLADMPEFEASGRAWSVDGEQRYDRVMLTGTFTLSPSSLANR